MKNLNNRVFAITGAASGIGRALALELARQGAVVEISDRNVDALRAVADEIASAGGRANAEPLDVADRHAVYAWADAVSSRNPVVNGIVNNAGVAMGVRVDSMPVEDFEWLMNINFWGVVHGTQAFLPLLQKADEAVIVNISSIFGVIGVPSQAAYNASKFAVRGFTEALRQELHGSNIAVTCVHPGGIRTNIARAARIRHDVDGTETDAETAAREFDRIAKTSPEQAARAIVGAIRARNPRLLIGADAHFLSIMQRLFPASYPSILRSVTRLGRKSAR